MGSCFSSSAAAANDYSSAYGSDAPPTAKVVAPDGSLREFAHAIKVHEVLSRVDHPSSCFLCCSDELHYDTSIPALGARVALQPGQIYFLLPSSMLGYRLTGADMAELAVKAASALRSSAAPPKQVNNVRKGRGRIRSMHVQVMPVAEPEDRVPEVTSAGGLDANFRSFHHVTKSYDDKKKKNSNSSSSTNPRGTATFLRRRVLRSNNAQRLGTIEEVADCFE